MKLLLDTNAYAAWKRGDERLVALVRNATEILVSVIVAGELQFGFRQGSRYQRNMAELREFLGSPYVTFIDATMTTADRFARIAAELRKKGSPIPTNDIWIAAHAMESGAELISFDQHFAQIDGLVWTSP